MFLKKIQLTNFKCYENLSLDFSTGEDRKHPVRKTTFLTGENGTGKSALLQAIALVTGGSEALHFVPGLPNDFIRQGAPFCEIMTTVVTAQGEERLLQLRLDRNAAVADIVADARISLFPMDAALSYTHRSYFTAGYGSGRRLGAAHRATNSDYRSPRYAAVHSLFNQDSLLRPLDEWTYATQYGSGHLEDGVAALKEALHIFLPQEVRFRGLEGGRFLFDTPDGLLPLEALSNGYQQTVAWVSNLLYHVMRTFGDYKNPLAARGLLLIDEIDLHLHPAWQQQLYAFLAKGLPHFQVIATTNSPLTAQQAALEEVFTLQRDVAIHAVHLQPATTGSEWLLVPPVSLSPIETSAGQVLADVSLLGKAAARHSNASHKEAA
jgi:hypothetical protein